MHRFFVEPSQIEGHQIRITGTDVNHIKNVLRMKTKDEILISDGERQEYTCYIEEMTQEEIVAHVMYVQESGLELSSKIYLFQGLPKSDKMELIIQKAVELGAWEVIPVATSRAVVKLDEKKAAKRWRAGSRLRRVRQNSQRECVFRRSIPCAVSVRHCSMRKAVMSS